MRNKIEWTPSMLTFLKLHHTEKLSDLAEMLGMSSTTVRSKLIELGFSRDRYPFARTWSEEEIAYLREHYPTGTIGDIADHFGVSPGTVSRKVKELGLQKSPEFDVRKYYHRYVKSYNHCDH